MAHRKADNLKDDYFHFLYASRTRDQSEYTNVSHSKVQFLAERNLRSSQDSYIHIVIYKPF